MQESDMTALNPAQFRFREAQYFYRQFIAHSGPPCDSYFAMVCYFDAFLFALVSVEEMVDKATKARLKYVQIFRFFKALRNATMHHSILGAPLAGSKFERPFSRHITECVGGESEASAKLAIRYDVFRNIFDAIEVIRSQEKSTLDAAREYLWELESRPQPVFLEQVLLDGLRAVAEIIA